MSELRNLIKSLFTKGSFVQNVGLTSSSKIIVLSLSFLFVPILSRLYNPDAYGNFALYNSITSIVVVFTLLGYPNAYTLVKRRDDFVNLIIFQMITIVSISIISIIPLLIISHSFNDPDGLLWYLPAGILINGFIGIFSNWMIRNKDFKVSAALESGGEILIRLVNLSIGILGNGYKYGLIIGNMSGRAIAGTINVFRFFRDEKSFLGSLKPDIVKRVLFEWRQYPKYILPNQLIQQFGSQLPVYFLAFIYGSEELGYFSMALTLFNIPVQLFSNAISPVFLQKAYELNSKSFSSLSSFTSRLVVYCQVLIFIPILILMVLSKEIIPFFLGQKWESTAIVISITSLYIYLEILITPLFSLFQVLRRELMLVSLNVFSLVLIISCLAIAIFLELPFYQSIIILTGAKAFSYIFQGVMLFRLLNLSFVKLIGFSYGVMVLIFTLTFLLNT